MKTSASLLSLTLLLALPATAQRAGSSSTSSGSHSSGGSSSHGSVSGAGHAAGSGSSFHASGASAVVSSAHTAYVASSSGYSAASASHFYTPAAPARAVQAAGRYVGNTPAARAAVNQRGPVRAAYPGSLVTRAGRPPLRTDASAVITRRGPFITSVPVLLPGQGFFFGFSLGFHHGFRNSFCDPFFGFCGFNAFNCFGSRFGNNFFWPWGFGYGSGAYYPGLYYGSAYYGPPSQAQPADTYSAYEPPSAPGTYTPEALTPAEPEQPAAPKPLTLLQLKDGSMYGVTDYWLDHGQLHYVASYGGENVVPLERVDLDKTIELNSAKGIDFILRNAPSAPPPPAPMFQPLEPMDYPEIIF